jgi:signal transduction histidine kinase
MSDAPRPPLLKRMPQRVRVALTRLGVGAFPVILCLTLLTGAPGARTGLLGWQYLLPTLVMVLPMGLLPARPLTAIGLMLLALFAVSAVFYPRADTWGLLGDLWNIWYVETIAVDLAVCFIAAHHPRRTSVTALVLVLLVEVGSTQFHQAMPLRMPVPSGPGPQLSGVGPLMVLALGVAWLVGHSIRQRREYAEVQRRQAAVQAVQAERLRIARELHDMIAHSIGVIAIQAGVGSRVIETQPAEARNALTVIEDTSRETLAGLRRMLGALRRAEPDPASTDPSPGLADLDRLILRSLDAGIRVDVRRNGEERPLPADIDLSAYRIVQEAVTNVVRHAGADECRVSLDYGADELSIEITDDGRGGVPGAGYGIPGMRERVSLLHGDFVAGPRPEGGFRVAARIPVPAEV